jgi:hypothetical protein
MSGGRNDVQGLALPWLCPMSLALLTFCSPYRSTAANRQGERGEPGHAPSFYSPNRSGSRSVTIGNGVSAGGKRQDIRRKKPLTHENPPEPREVFSLFGRRSREDEALSCDPREGVGSLETVCSSRSSDCRTPQERKGWGRSTSQRGALQYEKSRRYGGSLRRPPERNSTISPIRNAGAVSFVNHVFGSRSIPALFLSLNPRRCPSSEQRTLPRSIHPVVR